MARLLQAALAASVIFSPLSFTVQANEMTALRVCADPGNMPLSNTRGEGFQNKIAEAIAEALGTQVSYFYRPYLERGLTRQTFKNNSCDVLMGMSPDNERMITTTPLYRSTFVLASRTDQDYNFSTLDDERLKELKIGVFQHSAIRTELMEHGVSGTNVKLHIISHNADLDTSRQPTRQVQSVIEGKLDVAGAWGPLAGWYNTDKTTLTEKKPLTLLPLNSIDTVLPMEFELAIGLKKSDSGLRDKVEQALYQQRDTIKQILIDYGVPLVKCDSCIVSGDIPSHGKYKEMAAVIAKYEATEQSDVKELPAIIDAAILAGSSLNEELLNSVLAKDFTRIDYLVDRGADINARDTSGLTVLMNAVKGGSYELVRNVLAKNAAVDLVDRDGWTAVMHAAWLNEPKMIRTLGAGYGAKLDAIEHLTQSTALVLAVQRGKTLAAVALLDSGANPNITMGKAKYSALMVAAKTGQLPSSQTLLQYGAKADQQNDGGVTALMIASATNKPAIASILVKAGANPMLKDKRGETSIDIAKARKSNDVLAVFQRLNVVAMNTSSSKK